MDFPYLSVIVFLPVLGAIVLALLGNNPRSIKLIAAVFAAVPFILSLAIFAMYDRSASGVQFVEQASWIPGLNVQYYMGVDGLSLPLVLLTTFIGLVAVFVSWKIDLRVKEYFAWLLVLETGILGVFCSLDLIMFFVFWEVELIPMYLLISIWGTGRKEYSAIKFVLYTLIGSALMLAGILLLYFQTGTFDIIQLSNMGLDGVLSAGMATAIFFLIIFAFMVKLPVFPFHTWLPDAHTDAPTAVSVVLAGVLLKMGGYGMIRIVVGSFPEVAHTWAPLFVVLAVIGVIYGAALTLRQTDLKKLIAYSSVSHMGFVLLGVFALTQVSMTGAVLQMVSHGVITGLLFAMVGLVYSKTHERSIPKLGGLVRQMPVIAVVFSVAGLAALGLPGTSGFAAEAITFLGSFGSKLVTNIEIYTALAITGVVFGAGYILWMLRRVFYGPPKDEYNGVPDADRMEKVYIFAFVAIIMLIGLYPKLFTDVIKLGIQPILGGFYG